MREELFSVERLEEHARSLAAAQLVEPKPVSRHSLTERLSDNEVVLLDAYRSIIKAIDQGGAITPAAEWLIDNYHLVEKKIREIRSDLPPGFYRQLPKLAAGPFAGYPRVFGLAWAFVAHTDSRFEVAMLVRYVRAYQQVQPLTIGELWAISITLRIVLVENLRRLAWQIVQNRQARREADRIAERLLSPGRGGVDPAVVLGEYDKPLQGAFAVQLIHRLRDQGPAIAPALTWLDDRLAAQGTTVDAAVRDVHRGQGASNVTVRNIITSLALISDIDWSEVFERVSLVDEALGDGSPFGEMDFATRNLYRSAIEQLSRGSGNGEIDVARAAMQAAQRGGEQALQVADRRRADPGYYLIDAGRPGFEASIGFRPSWRDRLRHASALSGMAGYGGAIVFAAGILLALPLLVLGPIGMHGAALILLGALGTVPAIDAAVALVNRAVTFGFGPRCLPALALRHGIPENMRTLVAVPMLLSSPQAIEEQIERLEIHYLASPEGELHFALLSDWTDGASEHVEGDDALLAAARDGIARLNRQHGPAPGGPRFLLLHRRRVWNAGEGRWIGYERKRGKLHELNRLLRGANDTTFIGTAGIPPPVPRNVRYVVTLDADTRLPRDTIRRLIGKLAHPLNRPRFDADAGRVVEGYGVLQPRVTPSLPLGREGSLFQRVFSSVSGIDPYASAVSDVYQDLFAEGSYAGKGIYDIDAFEAALAGRAPDSVLLSHDLFEGTFARAGLASDIEVVEDFPARYDVGAIRHHRWARGDWQLLPWILGRGPAPDPAGRAAGAVPLVGRFKMLDNLRRTLSAPFAVLALAVGWMLPLPAALAWTVFVLASIVLPALIPLIAAIPPRHPGITRTSHLRALAGDLRLAAALSALHLVLLAHQAWLMGDAILRTLWRLLVTRRHLLEWTPAALTTMGPRPDLCGFYRRMAGAPAIAVTAALVAWHWGHGGWVLALPAAALWLASPAIAQWISLPPRIAADRRVSPADARALRLTARRTWRFFESVVTPLDYMLPPDNFQEDPVPVLAHRTSPTNLGLYLLAVASAHDFGWIGTTEAVERLEATLATMGKLDRFRGHFYNWYDTRDLRPLDPRYISSVDSGNLAGHLVALTNTLREWMTQAPDIRVRLAGVTDVLDLARAEVDRLRDGRRTQTVTWNQLDVALGLLEGLATALNGPAGLAGMASQAEIVVDIVQALCSERGDQSCEDLSFWAHAVLRALQAHRRDLEQGEAAAAALAVRLGTLKDTVQAMTLEMDFAFLFNPERKLLSIGYVVAEGALDANCYDLLASEARLASFIAIAKGDVPARHWFRLGRASTPVTHGAVLISWSGSMFEYLMPSLVMRAPRGSLLEQTTRLVVQRQIEYASALSLPWGISESAYNTRDRELTYQYSNFGVPGLGLKRGLGGNLVIAPYATALGAMVDPRAAVANLERLAGAGGLGRYGFYEALDYTPSRLPAGKDVAIVRTFMAHHQGMTIVAIADALLDGKMRARFHAEPMVQATELLLQERTPRDVAVIHAWAAEMKSAVTVRDADTPGVRRIASPHHATPVTHLLSNGRYATLVTAAGSGYARWGGLAVTRWREDATCDAHGSYVFLRDMQSGIVWSAGFQPTGTEPDRYAVTFTEDRAEITRQDGSLTTMLEVLVSAEDDSEVRRISITNTGSRTREIEVTSYAELALAPQAADVAHPAFSKLFVQTEYLPDVGAIVATRRRRAASEPEIWAAQLAVIDGEATGKPEIETDRARFIGRGRTIRTAIAMLDGRPLSNTVGTVLDPIFALRRRVRVPAGGVVRVAFWTIVASSREALLDGVDKHKDATAFTRAATLAWTQAQVQLYHLGITAAEASLFQRLAAHVIYAGPTLRPSSDTITRGIGPQSGLWGQGISGDLPIVLLRIAEIENIDVARQLLQAHEYWRMKQLAVDLVIVNEHTTSYIQDLQLALEDLVRTRQSSEGDPQTGRIFMLRADLLPAETRALLGAVARVVVLAQRGSLLDQFDRIADRRMPIRPPVRPAMPELAPPPDPIPPELEYFNGLGGFADGGREYVTILGPGQSTPAPWINVIANPGFGFQAAVEGSGYTWAVNSRENQLTPWSNDPISDPPGEAFYIRDHDSGDLWTPTALPIRDDGSVYIARHGRGYSRFEHDRHGIVAELAQYVPLDAPLKISRLVLRNRTDRERHLGVTAYVEWVLGPSRAATLPFVTTEIDPATGAMFARNPWHGAFGSRVAFADLRGQQTAWTGDRREFIGRNGALDHPRALGSSAPLSNNVGSGFDPCGALQTSIVLPANGTVEVVFLLGQAANATEAANLIARYRSVDLNMVEAEIAGYWQELLGTVAVRTPDRSMDIMLNGWLTYQTLACRIWARAAFYQASGAYGFRDQLQDGMALAAIRPAVTREHLLRAAARQFLEGDVQHWWLPHSGQGVRTRISDDRAWLAWAAAHYVATTGDANVLDESLPFLEGPQLPSGEHDSFFQPDISEQSATLFEHCARALEHSFAVGAHGLPLIGTGDWNDGMNRVGERGRGESVWLGWLLQATLLEFASLAERRGEADRAARWRAHAARLLGALEREAWDGDWYLRGYFDDGTPLGSSASEECRIDSIAQSWAVLSGAARPDRAARAMQSMQRELVRPGDGLALLFAPPFDTSPLDPGYIKAYPPGIRENGGQYTHAALWSVMAIAALGEGDQATELFSLLNPINHSRTRAEVYRYKVEPYVVAADVYAKPPHVGRGGWTWYTGSAAWMQRAGIESILGMKMRDGVLQLDPCIPRTWPGFQMTLRHGSARYEIAVDNPDAVNRGILSAELDGEAMARPLWLPLQSDGLTHHIHVVLG